MISDALEELKTFSEKAKALREGTPEEYRGAAAALDSDMSLLLGLKLHPEHDEWVRALDGLKLASLSWPRGTDESEKTELKEYRAALKKHLGELAVRFSHTMEEEKQAAQKLAGPIARLVKLTEEFRARFTELKASDGLIDFNDMEQLTLKILRNESIANEYRSRFRCVFVDEYQDINPAQEAILRAVSRENRFMVGDVKQSIYRFRQAEPKIFLEKLSAQKRGEKPERIDLNANFRSRPAILEAVNALFSELMLGGNVGEVSYEKEDELVPGLPLNEGDPTGEVELVLIDPEAAPSDEPEDEDYEDAPDATSAQLQAAYAARRIHEIMRTETLKTPKEERPYRFGDFTVLLRSAAGSADEWVNTLSQAGIPCAASSGSELFDALEVRIFADLLRVIDNRRQDIPLLAVMRSPIFDFTDEELIHIRADYEGEDVLDRVLAAGADPNEPPWGAHAKEFLRTVDRWRGLERILDVGEFVSRILDETGFDVIVSALRGGEARCRDLDALLETARAYSDSGKGGLGGFIRYIDEARASAPQKTAAAPSQDAVRLMTIHQSKGLEFPVVFLGDITRGFNRSVRSDVGVFDAELGIGLCSVSGDRGNRSMLQRAIARNELLRQNAEEMRVLYVAMTRAREKLIMLGMHKDAEGFAAKYAKPLNGLRIMRADRYADWMLGAYFPNGTEAERKLPCGAALRFAVCHADEAEAGSVGMSADALEGWMRDALFADTAETEARFAFSYEGEAATKLPSKLSVTGLTLRGTELAKKPRFMEDEGEPTGAEIGTVTHRLLQLISLQQHDADSVREELRKLTWQGLFSDREAGLVRVDSVVKFLDSPLGKRLIASERAEREKEFNLMLPAHELTESDSDEPIMLQGVIDCCFIENGAWVLVDHKTTRVDAAHTAKTVAERYRRQLELYSKALERLTGTEVREAYVYLLSADEAVKM